MKRYIFVILMLLLPASSNGEVIFEDNFDSHADWTASFGVTNDASPTGAVYVCNNGACASSLPTGYNYAYQTGMWFEPLYPNPVYIKGTLFDGTPLTQPNGTTNGKSYIAYIEPVTASGGWSSDTLLGKALSSEYEELYVQVKVKFQPGWRWDTITSTAQKFFRMGYYLGTGSGPWDSSNGGNSKPIAVWDLAKYASGASDIAMYSSIRCNNTYICNSTVSNTCYTGTVNNVDPYAVTCYFPPTGNYGGTGTDFTDSGMIGDGSWHTLQWGVKMNSTPGVADGWFKFWFDGTLIQNLAGVTYNDAGASRAYGVNFFLLGGNNNNYYTFDAGTHPEQWYAYDDLVVSTTEVSNDYVIGGADTTPPTVTAFTIPATSSSLTVSISTFTATDAVGVTGYCLQEIDSSTGCSWSGSAPTSYTFSTQGTKTLYAFARDAAGNVSTAATDQVAITLPASTQARMNGSINGVIQ